MLGLKLGLDTEIAVYKALLDTEEDRVARKNLLENGDSVPNGKKTDSESDEEGDGIFEKIKKKVEDIIDWLSLYSTCMIVII